MVYEQSCTEPHLPPARPRMKAATAPTLPEIRQPGSSDEATIPLTPGSVAARLGIEPVAGIERLRKGGYEFAWRRWMPFGW